MRMSWEVSAAAELSKDGIEALLANDIAAIRVPAFVPETVCSEATAAINAHGFDWYEKLEPPLGRIGITQYENREHKADYFDQAPGTHAVRRGIFGANGDPLALVLTALNASWPGGASIASEPGLGSYFAGLIRITVGGIGLHCDWGPQDGAGWSIDAVDGQLAWNIYYDLTESGGETTTFRQPWTPELEEYADSAAFGYYLPESVATCPCQEIAPRRGELVLINSRNLHSVAAAVGRGTRISASSFVGRLPDGSLALWS